MTDGTARAYKWRVTRALVIGIVAAVLVGLTGCAAARTQVVSELPQIAIAADKPPSPATWPKYPHFSQHSCWADATHRGVLRTAPSYLPPPMRRHLRPAEIARRFLAHFGDRRYIQSLALTSSRPAYLMNPIFRFHPPADGLSVIEHAPLADLGDAKATPNDALVHGIASWEAGLVFGGLRDDFCSAGGVPLVSAYGHGDGASTADSMYALEQRFPNPSPAEFRRRVALVGKRFGFHVVSLRLLRPEQIAPLLIVRTSRTRNRFSPEVPQIQELLDPTSIGRADVAETFEGFFFAAEDARGPFIYIERLNRGTGEGGQWAASENLLPFPHG